MKLPIIIGICMLLILLVGCTNRANQYESITKVIDNFNCKPMNPHHTYYHCENDLCDPFDDYGENKTCSFGVIETVKIPWVLTGCEAQTCHYTDFTFRFIGFSIKDINEINYIEVQAYQIGECPHNTSFINIGGEEHEVC